MSRIGAVLPKDMNSEGTLRYVGRFPGLNEKGFFRQAQGQWHSSIGIGTYLGANDDATDQAYVTALIRAVEGGCNVIDTASNYRFQRSEKTIGTALASLLANQFSREELIICTKAGFIRTDSPLKTDAEVETYIEEKIISKGFGKAEDIFEGRHCIAAEYLQSQIDKSLSNLNTDYLDVFYIHNPEIQLPKIGHDGLLQRIRDAFSALEECRSRKKIKYYGVASWMGFRTSANDTAYHLLEDLVTVAEEIAGSSHGFRYIQLPFNIAMPEAFSLRNQSVCGQNYSTLGAAEKLGITAVVSASTMQGKLANRLPNHLTERLGNFGSDTQTCLQFSRSGPNVTTALVGMKQTTHVVQNLEVGETNPLSVEDFQRLFTDTEKSSA